jgi:hypothetical protein
MPFTLRHEFVLLCEGAVDKAFFTTLLRERSNMPRFDIPFPEAREEIDTGKEPLGGRENFGAMLRAIRAPAGFAQITGILIAADSADNPKSTFDLICGQIRTAPEYTVPERPLVLSPRSPNNPQIMIMLIPEEYKPGGVETLYVREMVQQREWLLECIEEFLSCKEIPAHGWSQEKRDKARFHSMVAALYEPDPSRAASMIWKRRNALLLMDIHAQAFDTVETRIRNFAVAARTAVLSGVG